MVQIRIQDENDVNAIPKGVQDFLWDAKKTALEIILPENLNNLSGNLDLKPLLMPYAVELSASLLEYQLCPLFSYQMTEHITSSFVKLEDQEQEMDRLREWRWECLLVVDCIQKSIKTILWKYLCSPEELRKFLTLLYSHQLEQSIESNPTIRISDTGPFGVMRELEDKTVCKVQYAWSVEYDVYNKSKRYVENNTHNDGDTFTIVTTPYYPKEFWRYSKNVSIIVTRMTDFLRVPTKIRDKIRVRSNRVLDSAGVVLENYKWCSKKEVLEQSMQPAGLWLPKYDK